MAETWATVIMQGAEEFLEWLDLPNEVINNGQNRYKLIPTEHLDKTTRAGLIDMNLGPNGKPIIRVNNPNGGHGATSSPHISIGPNADKTYIKVPASLIACADKLDKCLKTASKALSIVALVTDGLRIFGAIYEDMNSDENHVLPHKTIETVFSIAGAWKCGAVGATAGAVLGAKIGACIGFLFGGVGAIIGAPIGAVVGSIAGGMAGGKVGGYVGGLLGREIADIGEEFLKNFKESHSSKAPESQNCEIMEWQEVFAGFHQSAQSTPRIGLDPLGALVGMQFGAGLGTFLGPAGTIAGGIGGAIYGALNGPNFWRRFF